MTSVGFRKADIEIKKVFLTFNGLQQTGTILWLNDILKQGKKIGAVSNSEMSRIIDSFNKANPERIHASFDFYITKGLKKPYKI